MPQKRIFFVLDLNFHVLVVHYWNPCFVFLSLLGCISCPFVSGLLACSLFIVSFVSGYGRPHFWSVFPIYTLALTQFRPFVSV